MLAKLTAFLNARRIFSHLLIPAAVLTLYSGVFAFFSARLLPEGVNPVFVSRLFQYGLIALAAIFLLFALSLVLRKEPFALPRYSLARISASELALLLLPLTPVAQYVIKNRDILTLTHSLYALGFFVLFCGAYIFLVPLLLGKLSSKRLLMVIGLAFAFTITSMSSLSQYFHWIKVGSLKEQLIFLVVVFLFCWVLSLPKNKNMFALLIALIFITNSAVQLFSKSESAAQPELTASDNAKTFAPPDFAKQPPASTPNIYLLVYDAYPQSETMQAYGIDNTAQNTFLKEQGFLLYPHIYSVGSTTLETMGSVLNVPAGIQQADRWSVSGGGSVQRIMKAIGYQTYGIFPYDYLFQKTGSSYDVSYPTREAASYAHLISATLMGEFRFDIGFTDITRAEYLAEKQTVFAQAAQKQHVFLYSHSNYPSHSQNSGRCLPDETKLWKGKLEEANIEMRQDVANITRADPNAIIIIAGDHGPYLTKNCYITMDEYPASKINRLDIQDRYGTFLAIRWPTADYAQVTRIRVLQDVFPSIFAYLYKNAAITGAEVEPVLINTKPISGVMVKDGIIYGGIDDGEPLFLSGK